MKSESEFSGIILELRKLKEVKADDYFKNRLYKKYSANVSPKAILFPIWRIAIMTLTAFIILGSTVVLASSAKPGNILYPVKKVIEKIEHNLNYDPKASVNSHLESQPTVTPTPTLTPTPGEIMSPEISPTPTPKPAEQSSNNSNNVSTGVDVLGTGVRVGIGDQTQKPSVTNAPTPTPNPEIINIDVSLNKKSILNIGL